MKTTTTKTVVVVLGGEEEEGIKIDQLTKLTIRPQLMDGRMDGWMDGWMGGWLWWLWLWSLAGDERGGEGEAERRRGG